jgi:predicted nucleic acid-binding Zn ribbon protein
MTKGIHPFCVVCKKTLSGKQTKFCSGLCKSRLGNSQYEAQKKRALRRKLKLVMKSGGKCALCGYAKNLSGLVFHHRQGIKDFQLDARNMSNRSWDSVVQELKKCQLLCHNCHQELHHPELSLPALLPPQIRVLPKNLRTD